MDDFQAPDRGRSAPHRSMGGVFTRIYSVMAFSTCSMRVNVMACRRRVGHTMATAQDWKMRSICQYSKSADFRAISRNSLLAVSTKVRCFCL